MTENCRKESFNAKVNPYQLCHRYKEFFLGTDIFKYHPNQLKDGGGNIPSLPHARMHYHDRAEIAQGESTGCHLCNLFITRLFARDWEAYGLDADYFQIEASRPDMT